MPWLCREKTIEVVRLDGSREHVPVDPEGRHGLQDEDAVYRVEFDALSRALADGAEPVFGQADSVGQARVIEALRESGESGTPLRLGA
ncbi:hypothetical protein [Streptomyces sp. NPDC001401]|uniref:hypothetical protein n=1 Tax=Streptomyces sp. NPDC001401 TaxID=3364570 RepID=UPI003699228C